MEMGFTTAVYVVAAILFILSLGGLSGQESATSDAPAYPSMTVAGMNSSSLSPA